METCLPCVAELIILLIDIWLYGKAIESREPRFDRPERRSAFRFWVSLFVVGVILLACVGVVRFYGWPVFFQGVAW